MPRKRRRVLAVMARYYARKTSCGFRSASNVSWLALRARDVGIFPKLLGVIAALTGVAPIEWIPDINLILALGAKLVVIPLLLGFAWWLVPKPVKARLEEEAKGAPVPWGFLGLVAAVFVAAIAVDTWFDFTYPGKDAGTPSIQPFLERFE
jgi:uncharacterized membrane protein YkvA (DUF1232 family)